MGTRDFVRFLPMERADIPDITALQQNARSETRVATNALLTGSFTSIGGHRRILGGFAVTADSPASALVFVSDGRGLGVHTLPDNSDEHGVIFGTESPSSQSLDFSLLAPNTYDIYVKYVANTGSLASRIFWNSATSAEEPGNLATRLVVSWSCEIATSSPGNEWQAIASVVWDGATVETGDITLTRRLFFEGEEPTFAHDWGAGNDRDPDRSTYGITDLYTWVAAMRKQLETIAGDSQKWFENFDRLSKEKFQIEGEETDHYWQVNAFYHSTESGNNEFKLQSRNPGNDGKIWARDGSDIDIHVFQSGDLLLSVTGGTGGSLQIDVASGDFFTIQTDTLDLDVSGNLSTSGDISAGGDLVGDTVEYNSIHYVQEQISPGEMFAYMLTGDEGVGGDFMRSTADVGLANSDDNTDLGFTYTGLGAQPVIHMKDAGWWINVPIDHVLHHGAVLQSVILTVYADTTDDPETRLVLRRCSKTSGNSWSTVVDDTVTINGTDARQQVTYTLGHQIDTGYFYQLRWIDTGGGGNTEHMLLLVMELIFACQNVKEATKVYL